MKIPRKKQVPRNPFISAFRELTMYGRLRTLLETLLDSVLVFLISLLFLSIVSFYARFAFLIALTYFVIAIYVRMRENYLDYVEAAYPELREKLRTAAQYRASMNPLAQALREEVARELRRVSVSSVLFPSIMAEKGLTMKTGKASVWPITMQGKVIGVLFVCFLLIATSLFNTYFIGLKLWVSDSVKKAPSLLDDLMDEDGGGSSPLLSFFSNPFEDEELKAGTSTNLDIYGDPNLAALGEKEQTLNVEPLGLRMDLAAEGEIPEDEFSETSPYKVNARPADKYKEERIKEEHREVVKKYYQLLAAK